MKPSVHNLVLSPGRSFNIVTFSMKDMILRMVTNKLLFHAGNILLDPDRPCELPKDTTFYGDVNSGSWRKNTIAKECTDPQHIHTTCCRFINGLAVDKYGNINVEAVLTCCLWFNRKARNRSSTWWAQGFVEDQTLFRDQNIYVKTHCVQDYHKMLSRIFQEMHHIRQSSGIRLKLDFEETQIHQVIAIPVIQFIIGGCKGNDMLCGRIDRHTL